MCSYVSKSCASRLPFGLPSCVIPSSSSSSSSSSPTTALHDLFSKMALDLESFVSDGSNEVFAKLLAEDTWSSPAQCAAAASAASAPLSSRGAQEICRFLEQHPSTQRMMAALFSDSPTTAAAAAAAETTRTTLEEQLCYWIFSDLDPRFAVIFSRFMQQRAAHKRHSRNTAPIASVLLRTLTAAEILIRRVPGAAELEGLGLLNQLVKARLLTSKKRSDGGDDGDVCGNISGNEETTRRWNALLILLRLVLVDGKGMHLRNVVWHGYVLPRDMTAACVVTRLVPGDGGEAVAVGSMCVLVSALVAGSVVKLLARCLALETGAADLTTSSTPDDWNGVWMRDLFQHSDVAKRTAAIVQEKLENDKRSNTAHSDPLLTDLFEYGLSFRTSDTDNNSNNNNNNSVSNTSRLIGEAHEILLPVLLVTSENMLRGYGAALGRRRAHRDEPSAAKSSLDFAVLHDTHYMCDIEDALSWQGLVSLQPADGPLRRGIQRIRDITDALLPRQGDNKNNSDESAFPRNRLLDVLPLDLFVAWRGLLLTLSGPRLRDTIAHGKLAVSEAAMSYRYTLNLLGQTIMHFETAAATDGAQTSSPFVLLPSAVLRHIAGTATHCVDNAYGVFVAAKQKIRREISQQQQLFNSSEEGDGDNTDGALSYSISIRNGLNHKIGVSRALFAPADDTTGTTATAAATAATTVKSKPAPEGKLLFSNAAELLFALKENDAIFSSAHFCAAVAALDTVAASHGGPDHLAAASVCDSTPYAVRSTHAVTTQICRLLCAATSVIEASLKKWGSTPTTSAAAVTKKKSLPARETLPILHFVLAVLEHGVEPVVTCPKVDAVILAATKSGSKTKIKDRNSSAGTAGRCLLDKTLPFEILIAKQLARNVPVLEAFAADLGLPALGKVAFACLNWAE